MKCVKALLIMAVGLAIWLAGCDVKDPGSPLANQRPTVELTFAPVNGDTVEHYKQISWRGNDADGQIVQYRVLVDGAEIARTTATDTVIAFAAPETDVVYPRSLGIIAEDNEGLLSETAIRSFYVINWAPVASFDPEGSIPANATVGQAFRVSILSSDTNASLTDYNLSLDDSSNGWMGWMRDSVFLFAAPEILADSMNFPDGVRGIPNAPLTAGAHTLYAKVRDAGGAVSRIVSLPFTVSTSFAPVMDTSVVANYGDDAFYVDGSIYYSTSIGIETRLEYSASATAYFGEINAYRWRLNNADWSEWNAEPEVVIEDAAPGEYLFEFQARDAANVLSETVDYSIIIARQVLSDSIIVVDETADGNGNPGSPNDPQADQFYANIMQGYKTRVIDYATHRVGSVSYVSPLDVKNAGVILWHGDDQSNIQLDDNTRLLTEFLNRGGRLIISGWDVLGGFAGAVDSIEFSTTSFGGSKLRLYEGRRNTARNCLGFNGEGAFPGCRIDSTKLPPAFRGQLLKTWSFQPSGECLIMGRMAVADSATNPFHGRPAAYLYYQSFRVAVFGVPLYFCNEAEVRSMIDVLMPWMLQGL